MAKHQYARTKDPKKAEKRVRLKARQAAAKRPYRTSSCARPTAYLCRDGAITRNGSEKLDGERWAAIKPSTKEGFADVHVGDYPTIGAAHRALTVFAKALRGKA